MTGDERIYFFTSYLSFSAAFGLWSLRVTCSRSCAGCPWSIWSWWTLRTWCIWPGLIKPPPPPPSSSTYNISKNYQNSNLGSTCLQHKHCITISICAYHYSISAITSRVRRCTSCWGNVLFYRVQFRFMDQVQLPQSTFFFFDQNMLVNFTGLLGTCAPKSWL